MARPKTCGGLGFWITYAFNKAFLGKQWWRLLSRPYSLAARMKGRALPNLFYSWGETLSKCKLFLVEYLWGTMDYRSRGSLEGCQGHANKDMGAVLDSHKFWLRFTHMLHLSLRYLWFLNWLITSFGGGTFLCFVPFLESRRLQGYVQFPSLFACLLVNLSGMTRLMANIMWSPDAISPLLPGLSIVLLLPRCLMVMTRYGKKLWRIMGPPRCWDVLWRTCHDIPPAKKNLLRQGITSNDIFPCVWVGDWNNFPCIIFMCWC